MTLNSSCLEIPVLKKTQRNPIPFRYLLSNFSNQKLRIPEKLYRLIGVDKICLRICMYHTLYKNVLYISSQMQIFFGSFQKLGETNINYFIAYEIWISYLMLS